MIFDPGVDPTVLWVMFKQYLLLSVLTIGGANTALSEFHRFLVLEQGWLSEQRFDVVVKLRLLVARVLHAGGLFAVILLRLHSR